MSLVTVLCLGALTQAILAQAPPAAPQDTPPVIPAGDVPAPPVKPATQKTDAKSKNAAKKTAAKDSKKDKSKTDSAKTSAGLSHGPAVARAPNVNLRGQPAINSEIVTHVRKGDLVTVLDEVTLKSPGVDEPARWAKVSLPAGSVVWVNAQFIEPASKAVIPKLLNLRSGPGENYSILGRVDKGYVVKEVETKGDWIKIEAPANSYAFIAAHLLSTDPADVGPALAKANPPAPPKPPPVTETAIVTAQTTPPPPAPLVKPVTESPPPATAPPPAGAPPPAVVVAPPPPSGDNATTVAPLTPPVEEPPAKRVVTREGIVKGSASIQAPTYFVLRSLDNNKTINYLYAPDTNVVMRSYQFQRVIVTGEEILDERWPNTPVITIDNIQMVP